MLKISGAVLLILGTAGFAFSICRERRKRLLLLKDIKEMYRLLQSEICYTALPLPEIFKIVGEKLNFPFEEVLFSISGQMTLQKGEDLKKVWEREMGTCLDSLPLTERQKELLLKFPECVGMNESKGQANALNRYIEEIDRFILQMEEEEKSKNKVIMSLGIAAGLFMVIILL